MTTDESAITNSIDEAQAIASIVFAIVYGSCVFSSCLFSSYKHYQLHFNYNDSTANLQSEYMIEDIIHTTRVTKYEKARNKRLKKKQNINCFDYFKMLMKLIGKEMWRTKSIYFGIFVHLFDTVTDYLLLI